MFNAINEVQRQYTYAVQPVQLFETRNKKAESKNPFEQLNIQTDSSKYNLHHPNISNSDIGGKLDFLS